MLDTVATIFPFSNLQGFIMVNYTWFSPWLILIFRKKEKKRECVLETCGEEAKKISNFSFIFVD